MTHSPTPWAIDEDGYIFDANSKEVILSSADNIGLIVEAVNDHETILETNDCAIALIERQSRENAEAVALIKQLVDCLSVAAKIIGHPDDKFSKHISEILSAAKDAGFEP